MSDRPIIFSAPMVRALLDGRKTQTRRIFDPPKPFAVGDDIEVELATGAIKRKWGAGDRLWVREAMNPAANPVCYAADGVSVETNRADQDLWMDGYKRDLCPSIHMPRWASRMTLIVTSVCVQRLQEISKDDAAAEGLLRLKATGRYVVAQGDQYLGFAHHDPRVIYENLWGELHGVDAWAKNPWVSAITFRVIRANIDASEARA